VVTARGFSQVELYRSLTVTDPKGVRHILAGDDAHEMLGLYTLGDQDWDLAEVLPQDWARTAKIGDLREKVPTMYTIAGCYTIEAQQPFVRFAVTGNEPQLGLIGLVDDPNKWSGSLKSNKLQIYVVPGTGARVGVQVVNTGVEPAQPLGQVPVKIMRKGDIPAGSTLAAAWDNVVPVLTGTSDFAGKTVWMSEASCLANNNYTVLAKYAGEVKGTEILQDNEPGWASGCTGSIEKVVSLVDKPSVVNVTVSGGAYNYPETQTYRATFSMDVKRINGTSSGWLKYNYTRTRMNFVSTGITEVLGTTPNPTIRGVGTVNNVKGYSFEAAVVDGSPDSFGIVIRKADGTIYYSAPAKVINGGNLIITQ
jgi:hypothetical protein